MLLFLLLQPPNAFPMRFVSFVSLVSLVSLVSFVSLVSLCELVHQIGRFSSGRLLFPKGSLDSALITQTLYIYS